MISIECIVVDIVGHFSQNRATLTIKYTPWTVGFNSLTDPSNQDREISVTTNNISVDVWSSVLIIRALPINNGSEIIVGCIILGQTSKFVPKGATSTNNGRYEHTNQY